VALDVASGSERWRVAFAPQAAGQYSGCNGGVFVGDLFVTSAEDGRVYALDRATGAVRWTAPRVHMLPTENAAGVWNDVRPLAASGDLVVVGSSTGTVVALEAATGAERWRATANRGSIIFRPAVGDDAVYANHILGQLAAFDRTTGALRWMSGIGQSRGEYFGAPVVEGDHLYINGFTAHYALRVR
jgi:outer membrane protein assembly factor BamB